MLEKRVFTLHLTRLTRVSTRIFRVVSRFDTCQSFRVTNWHGSNVSCHPLTRFKKLTDTNLTRNETNRFETFQPDTCHSLRRKIFFFGDTHFFFVFVRFFGKSHFWSFSRFLENSYFFFRSLPSKKPDLHPLFSNHSFCRKVPASYDA